MKRYKVTCLECKKSDILTIDETGMQHTVIDYDGKLNTNFRSFRWRPDLKWGFECMCGNENRLAPKESDDFDKLVKGDPLTVKKIAANLLVPDEQQFSMEAA